MSLELLGVTATQEKLGAVAMPEYRLSPIVLILILLAQVYVDVYHNQ